MTAYGTLCVGKENTSGTVTEWVPVSTHLTLGIKVKRCLSSIVRQRGKEDFNLLN